MFGVFSNFADVLDGGLAVFVGAICLTVSIAAVGWRRRSPAAVVKPNSSVDVTLTYVSPGVLMFDRDQRLIVCTDRYREKYGITNDALTQTCTRHAALLCRSAA